MIQGSCFRLKSTTNITLNVLVFCGLSSFSDAIQEVFPNNTYLPGDVEQICVGQEGKGLNSSKYPDTFALYQSMTKAEVKNQRLIHNSKLHTLSY